MKNRFWAGKTLILALLSVSVTACGNGLPFGHKQADAGTLQSSISDPQARAFYQARQWKAAWDNKAEKQLLDIIAGAPANGLISAHARSPRTAFTSIGFCHSNSFSHAVSVNDSSPVAITSR